MPKQTLKERLEKKYIGKKINSYYSGEVCTDTILSIDPIPESTAFPLRGNYKRYCPHTVRILKCKQKKPQVTYEELVTWWNAQADKDMCLGASRSGSFQSLCELLGVKP